MREGGREGEKDERKRKRGEVLRVNRARDESERGNLGFKLVGGGRKE